ncbi:hypothetical protein BSKO_08593 [Bryopsis sp. KO-2023]|nr:hypothetical protein BSKO_08593 [Bryopsis sp. KO-2023]
MDYYAVLGVDSTATIKEIKQAYRSKALRYHPDLNPDKEAAREEFSLVNEAYEVLSDAQKRATYDRVVSCGPEFLRKKAEPSFREDDAFDEFLKEFWRKYKHRFDEEQGTNRKREKYRNYAEHAAAWEREKQEAKIRKVHIQRKQAEAADARRARVATTLRGFWQTNAWGTRQDLAFLSMVVIFLLETERKNRAMFKDEGGLGKGAVMIVDVYYGRGGVVVGKLTFKTFFAEWGECNQADYADVNMLELEFNRMRDIALVE